MENRYACAPEHVAGMRTAELRERFLVENLFTDGEVNFTYSHHDRVILAGAVPAEGAQLELPTPEALHAEHLFDNREAGIINIGADAEVTVDGQTYTVAHKGLLYVGRGTRSVTFSAPGRFYLYSAPAHTEYPTTLVGPDEGNVLELGEQETSNKRTLRQLLFNGDVKSCQVMMGVTTLAPGSMWNTMPAHTHDRRMEAYLYFDVADEARVIHLMGEPSETRHLVVANEQAVISPSWSVHSGVGTKAYSFIWAMAGENQKFDDMDPAPVTSME
ncbi:5-dehydro-4-deoxy-D-glucuronate isomerase [Tessaracoccus rhinocerotis]|uniref:4-deoxy-L-threo-5-hexosulose-uronate ketol-isomerase n=1 Tax=Tessaracoccus rhinocerotis TaxID=1689449 RepID=A0A553JZL6_9ACTN|nr:5-dehydro-4-deoxy-D-glucuronate isomerase [Tessaracoccus rhinocerotis]TRY17893.1 5-dehydro-4-deoxy-D-glucuronate isomerase [Tessaracoccus rhinocerotis]